MPRHPFQRAQRRHDADRVRQRLARRIAATWSVHGEPGWVERQARRLRDNPVTCSNPWCCGNPRGTGKGQASLTMQERRCEGWGPDADA